jgi:hypothetical protein
MNMSKAGPTPCRSFAITMLLNVKVHVLQISSVPRFHCRSSTGKVPGAPLTVMFLQPAA